MKLRPPLRNVIRNQDIRQILNKTAETEKGSRQSIEALNRQITELQLAIGHNEKLTHDFD
jgi:hypothetical protein